MGELTGAYEKAMLAVQSANDNDEAEVLWSPDPNLETEMDRFAQYVSEKRGLTFETYEDLHAWSVDHLGQFLNDAWDFLGVQGDKGGVDEELVKYTDTEPYIEIFPNAKFNIAQNIMAGFMKDPDKKAIISKHQDDEEKSFTGRELHDRVSIWQQAFDRAGIRPGDYIGLSSTNEVEADAILLAAASKGAILMPVGIGMGSEMMAKRFGPTEPKLLIAGDGHKEFGPVSDEKGAPKENVVHLRSGVINAVREALPSIEKTIVLPTLDSDKPKMNGFKGAQSVDDFLGGITPQKEIDYELLEGNATFLANGSSGSTGVPKVFAHGGVGAYLKNLIDHVLHNNLQSDDVYFQHSKQEWMMWPYQLIAGATGATLLKYNGNPGYPNPYNQMDFAIKNGTTVFGGAAAVVTLAWSRHDFKPQERYSLEDLQRVRLFTSTGSVLPRSGFHVAHSIFPQAKISSVTGGTDSLSVNAGGNPKHPTVSGELDGWQLGIKGKILRFQDGDPPVFDGSEAGPGELGEMAYPVPPFSFATHLIGKLEDVQKQWSKYFINGDKTLFWRDLLMPGTSGFEHMGRAGNVLNISGVALGHEEVYGPIRAMDGLEKMAAVAYTHPKSAQDMLILFVETDGRELDDAMVSEIRKRVGEQSRSDAVPSNVFKITMPETPTGKIPDVLMKQALANRKAPDNDLAPGKGLEPVVEVGQRLYDSYAPKDPESGAVPAKG